MTTWDGLTTDDLRTAAATAQEALTGQETGDKQCADRHIVHWALR